MPVHLLRQKPTAAQFAAMLAEHTTVIKVVVDVRRKVLAAVVLELLEGVQ